MSRSTKFIVYGGILITVLGLVPFLLPPAVSAPSENAEGAITWAPASITDTANPGSHQNVVITLTAKKDLSNVAIVVVPELRNIISVTPSSFAFLEIGKAATATIAVAPPTGATLGTVKGAVRAIVGSVTQANPLPVSITLVAPEVINGITVPPEPPTDLNNATLAGFDANGNGVRDDVERKIAATVSSQEQFDVVKTVAAYYQLMTAFEAQSQSESDALLLEMTCAASKMTSGLTSRDIQVATTNTDERRKALRSNTAKLGGIAVDMDSDCK